MSRFKGGSTKYLVNDLYWMKWLEYFKNDKEVLKGKNMLLQTVSTQLEQHYTDNNGANKKSPSKESD